METVVLEIDGVEFYSRCLPEDVAERIVEKLKDLVKMTYRCNETWAV